MAFAVSAGLVDHDAVGIGRLHHLFTAGRVAGPPDVTALRRNLRHVAPPLLIRNRGAKRRIVVPARAAPQIHGMAVEVGKVRIPRNRADAQRALERIHHNAVHADDVVDLVHIRLAIDRVIRIPQSWICNRDQLIEHRCGRRGKRVRRHRRHRLRNRRRSHHHISTCIHNLRGQGNLLCRRRLVDNVRLYLHNRRGCSRSPFRSRNLGDRPNISAPGLLVRVHVERNMNWISYI